jgi:tRNA pseudouridine32 synthase/23S rRNA pseudouridine746 synthase
MKLFDHKAPFQSKVYLPKLDFKVTTIFEYLVRRFPYLGQDTLARRIEQGKLFFSDGTPVLLNSPYQYGITIFYYRETEQELELEVQEKIIFQNEEIIVVDKPPFIPVTPSGKYINQCLLSRIIRKCENNDITPIHRLDKETAGLVIFSKNNKNRHLYHKLFQDRKITKKYYAVCHIKTKLEKTEWVVENRIVEGEPWFRMKIDLGQANSITHIKLLDSKEGKGLFLLTPKTGKKHQLRLHLSNLGFNIVNDSFYPEIVDTQDYSNPMQLLAYLLSFCDPITGEDFEFFSQQKLEWPNL